MHRLRAPRRLSVWLLLSALALAAGCSDGDDPAAGNPESEVPPPTQVDFTLEFSGFGEHNGQALWIAFAAADVGTTVIIIFAEVTAGNFTEQVTAEVREGATMRLDFFFDVNANNDCDPPPTDHAWSRALPPITGDSLTVALAHDAEMADVCDTFPFAPNPGSLSVPAGVGKTHS